MEDKLRKTVEEKLIKILYDGNHIFVNDVIILADGFNIKKDYVQFYQNGHLIAEIDIDDIRTLF